MQRVRIQQNVISMSVWRTIFLKRRLLCKGSIHRLLCFQPPFGPPPTDSTDSEGKKEDTNKSSTVSLAFISQ